MRNQLWVFLVACGMSCNRKLVELAAWIKGRAPWV
jgi:hypothetical protein